MASKLTGVISRYTPPTSACLTLYLWWPTTGGRFMVQYRLKFIRNGAMPSNPLVTTITVSSSSTLPVSPVYIPDYTIRPFNVTVGVVPTSSGSTAAFAYNVEYTLDNTGPRLAGSPSSGPGGQNTGAMAFVSSLLQWYSSLLVGASSIANAVNITWPVSGVRTNITSGTSNCSVVMTVLQSG